MRDDRMHVRGVYMYKKSKSAISQTIEVPSTIVCSWAHASMIYDLCLSDTSLQGDFSASLVFEYMHIRRCSDFV